MIEIDGTALHQWDVGRRVVVTGIEVEYVHFANQGDSKAVVMGAVDIHAQIPDFLLQSGKQLCVYAVKDGITVESKTFFVKKRERPENYVYEEDWRNYIYELVTNAEEAIESMWWAYQDANLATENANASATSANQAAGSANLAAENANEAAVKASHTAKSLMVIGSAKGNNIYLDDAIDQFFVGMRIFGKTTQDGTPTPDAPVELESVENPKVTVNDQTLLIPYTLHGIPVTSGGNYIDANGQQWICDEIDFARDVYVQRTKKVTVNGSNAESWIVSGIQSVTGATRFDANIATEPRAGQTFCLCNTYNGTNSINKYAETCWCNDATTISSLQFRICTAYVTTVEELKEILQITPVEFVYQLATPIETPLSAEELAAFASLHTYRDNTTISNDAHAHMEIEYVMDAKKYIDSQIYSTILQATVE